MADRSLLVCRCGTTQFRLRRLGLAVGAGAVEAICAGCGATLIRSLGPEDRAPRDPDPAGQADPVHGFDARLRRARRFAARDRAIGAFSAERTAADVARLFGADVAAALAGKGG